jgi:hypothetical protein
MKYIVSSLLALSVMGTAGLALADNPAEAGYVSPNEYHPVMVDAPSRYPFKVGPTLDLGLPSGVALGLQFRLPSLPWFKINGAATYTLAPGIRGGLMLDPINFPVAPVVTADIGRQFPFTVPSVSGKPSVEFNYGDVLGGLAFGSRDSARFMLLVGESYLNGSVRNVQGAIKNSNGLTFNNPTFSGWVPSARIAFNFLF